MSAYIILRLWLISRLLQPIPIHKTIPPLSVRSKRSYNIQWTVSFSRSHFHQTVSDSKIHWSKLVYDNNEAACPLREVGVCPLLLAHCQCRLDWMRWQDQGRGSTPGSNQKCTRTGRNSVIWVRIWILPFQEFPPIPVLRSLFRKKKKKVEPATCPVQFCVSMPTPKCPAATITQI